MIIRRQYIPHCVLSGIANPVPGAAAQLFAAANQAGRAGVYVLVRADPGNAGHVTVGGISLVTNVTFGIQLNNADPPLRIDFHRWGDVWIVDELASGTQKLRWMVFV